MKQIREGDLEFVGWGLVGKPQDDILIVDTSGIARIDVTGYIAGDYWDGDTFLGPDPYGIVPIYRTRDGGRQFPDDAKRYPYYA